MPIHMPRFAANLSMLYPELPFLERFEAAARDGFRGVEFLFPYTHEPRVLAERLRENDLEQVLFNAPPGDWDNGERGIACLPGREREFLESIDRALHYAEALHCPRIHFPAGRIPPDSTRDSLRSTYVSNIRRAARAAAPHGVQVLIEPINPRDVPGFFLNRQDDAHALVSEIGEPNVRVQFDLYHCQIVEGDVAEKIRRYLPTGRVGHFQVAGVPGRHEPDVGGELDAGHLFKVLDEVSAQCRWVGWVGCEYNPSLGPVPGGTSAGLGWRYR